jgi:hypothetical protein
VRKDQSVEWRYLWFYERAQRAGGDVRGAQICRQHGHAGLREDRRQRAAKITDNEIWGYG